MKQSQPERNSAYDPIPRLGESPGKRVDAVGDVRPGPREGGRRHNLCNSNNTTDKPIRHQTQTGETVGDDPSSSATRHPARLSENREAGI